MSKFNRQEWELKVSLLSNEELIVMHDHHLNYVPNSPVTYITMTELKKRGLWKS